MPAFQAIRLQPRGAFHFGTHGIGVEESGERCPSDTLYAALFNEALRSRLPFFAPPEDDIQPLDPPLLLSSCFPYAGEVLLLPLPRLPLRLPELEGQRKQLKNLTYVSQTIFNRILTQRRDALTPYLPTALGGQGQGRFLMSNTIWAAIDDGTLPGDSERLWATDTVPHVTVDRMRDSSAYYEVGQVHFAEGCGLYVVCQERQPGAHANLLELLARLGDSGLGGRRSRGLGQFRVQEAAPLTLDDPAAPARSVLLSRYRPSVSELEHNVLGDGASYELARVGGWLQTSAAVPVQRRRAVRLLSEGSVVRLPSDGAPLLGSVVDVRPRGRDPFPHPVWRYGLALGAPIGEEVSDDDT